MGFEGKIKGIHILRVTEYAKKKRGVIGLNELLSRINKDRATPQKLSAEDFKESDWYPYELYIDFLTEADEICGTGDYSKIFDIGRHTIQNLGHLSYLTRAPDIFEFTENAVKNWKSVYDFGRLEVVEKEEKRIVLRYHGFPKYRQTCRYFKGSLTGTLDICKLDGKVEETACVSDGDEYCEYVLTWE